MSTHAELIELANIVLSPNISQRSDKYRNAACDLARHILATSTAAAGDEGVTLTKVQAKYINDTFIEYLAFLSMLRKVIQEYPLAVVDANRLENRTAKSRKALGITTTTEAS